MSIMYTNEDKVYFESIMLMHIGRENDDKILSILRGDAKIDESIDSKGRTLLHFAAEYGKVEFAKYLIHLGAEVDAQDRMKQTPLMLAVELNQPAIVQVLLEAGADIFIPDAEGHCTLGVFLKKSEWIDEDIYTNVLDKVTVESLKDSVYVANDVFHRDCPLYQFMRLKNAEVTRILLEKGSPVDAKIPVTNKTALHEAVRLNCLENVKLLLEYGADVNAKEQIGRTPLDFVWSMEFFEESCRDAMIKVLIGAAANLFDPVSRRLIVMRTLLYGSRRMICRLLWSSLDLHIHDKNGITPLHYLCQNHCTDILEELQHFEFDVKVRDGNGRTMLHYAAFWGNPTSVEFLLNRGADVDARDNSGKTPLCFVADPSLVFRDQFTANYVNCVEILTDHGADVQTFMQENILIMRGNDRHIEPIFAKIVLLEASGRQIDSFVRNSIESDWTFKRMFDSVRVKLEEMKRVQVDDSMTLFDFMINKLTRLARDKILVTKLIEVMEDFSAFRYYHYMLHQRFWKLMRMVECREKLVPVMNEIFSKFCNLLLPNIVDQIIDCLLDEMV